MFRKRKKSHERKQYNSGEGNYKGEMKDNTRHCSGTDDGYGTYTFINGDVYTGSWEDDCPNGSGTLKYASGAVYTGEWRDGQRHGKCTFDGQMVISMRGVFSTIKSRVESAGIRMMMCTKEGSWAF